MMIYEKHVNVLQYKESEYTMGFLPADGGQVAGPILIHAQLNNNRATNDPRRHNKVSPVKNINIRIAAIH
jgi:hypothetical protein